MKALPLGGAFFCWIESELAQGRGNEKKHRFCSSKKVLASTARVRQELEGYLALSFFLILGLFLILPSFYRARIENENDGEATKKSGLFALAKNCFHTQHVLDRNCNHIGWSRDPIDSRRSRRLTWMWEEELVEKISRRFRRFEVDATGGVHSFPLGTQSSQAGLVVPSFPDILKNSLRSRLI